MKRFTRLYTELENTNRTNEKVAALEAYFREVPAADAAWALQFLCGRKLPRAVTSSSLRAWAAEEAALPLWLVDECYDAVGDLAETVSLILPENESKLTLPLHELVTQRLLPLGAGQGAARTLLLQTWREMDRPQRLVWNKLITGSFRVGVAQTLVVRALAAVAQMDQAIMAHRLMGQWQPTAEDFTALISDNPGLPEPAKPYPFYLASPLEEEVSNLGELAEWQAEWKWDGIRAQLIQRAGATLIWSRGEEMVTETFPEIAEAAAALPSGTVLDGEILAWRDDRPEAFARLQRRLGRKQVGAKMRRDFPVVFLAYDLLEWNGEDWRERALTERRAQLEQVIAEALRHPPQLARKQRHGIEETPDLFAQFGPGSAERLPLRISEVLAPTSWGDVELWRKESRARQVEGIMLKRRASPYGVGRQRGHWWKWKIDPLVMDAVLINAQLGHGRRASLYTDYTFGVWDQGKLVPVAKAYSGLSDEEIGEVDAFVRANTTDNFGPIRAVKPELVFELAFEGIQESTRHKAGIAVRFPRMNRWRHDKKAAEADTLDSLRALVKQGARG